MQTRNQCWLVGVDLELFLNIIIIIQHLFFNHITDNAGKERVYDEMWTADWWWDTQVSNGLAGKKEKDLALLGQTSNRGHCYDFKLYVIGSLYSCSVLSESNYS